MLETHPPAPLGGRQTKSVHFVDRWFVLPFSCEEKGRNSLAPLFWKERGWGSTNCPSSQTDLICLPPEGVSFLVAIQKFLPLHNLFYFLNVLS